MRKVRRRHVAHAAIAAVVGALAFAGRRLRRWRQQERARQDWQISGLGSSLDEIQQKAKDEGQVNLVEWAGYADKSWADEFTKQTGCKVSTKDGATSDDMVDLIATGAVRRRLRVR